MDNELTIRFATEQDIPVIFSFIKELAHYEKLSHEVVATEVSLKASLFGEKPDAEVILAYLQDEPVSFALFFHNFSTFLARPGIYLEDLYVKPEVRGQGVGKKVLQFLACLAKERKCGRFEWSVLNWNESAIQFYEKLGARPMDGWTTYRLTGNALIDLAES